MSGGPDEFGDETGPAGPATGERRGAERVDLDGAVLVAVAGMPPLAGRVRSVALQGLLLVLPSELPLGAEVRVTLQLEDAGAPLELRALVVRQTRDGSGPLPVRVGMFLISPNTNAVRRLSELIYACSR